MKALSTDQVAAFMGQHVLPRCNASGIRPTDGAARCGTEVVLVMVHPSLQECELFAFQRSEVDIAVRGFTAAIEATLRTHQGAAPDELPTEADLRSAFAGGTCGKLRFVLIFCCPMQLVVVDASLMRRTKGEPN